MRRTSLLQREAGRQPLLTYPMILLTVAAFASLFGFQLMLPVIPLYAERLGGGAEGAGLTTAAFMLTTVLAQTQMPGVLRRFGYRASLAAGLALLALPGFLYPLLGTLSSVLAVTLARGVGFGMVTVIFAAMIVEIAPPERRGEALGMLGIAITLPTIFCNALGLWLVEHFGFTVVFLLGSAAPLPGLLAALSIAVRPAENGEKGAGFVAGLSRPPLLRLALLFSAATMASGMIITFLPLARPGSGVFSAAGGLLLVGISATASRWWAGRFSDRHDAARLLAPGLLLAALGVALIAGSGTVMLTGALLFGTGFGMLQNSTLILTMQRVAKTEYGLGSTLWNAAFDAGTGLGAFAFGFVIPIAGFSAAFQLCSVLVASAILLAYLDRRPAGNSGGG